MRNIDALIRKCEFWLEDASYEFTDQIILIITLAKKVIHGRVGNAGKYCETILFFKIIGNEQRVVAARARIFKTYF
jgi:hypothetical protein